jgi:Ca-activated chloride channel family protein
MKKRFLFCAVVLALMGAAVNSPAIGLIIVPEQEGWRPPVRPPIWPPPHPPVPPRPWLPQPHPFAPLELTSVRVHTRITDQVAVTTVDQEFFNPNPVRLEGTFVFPVPKGAQLDKFSMEIDGRKVAAELLAADKARAIYEDIVRKLRDPPCSNTPSRTSSRCAFSPSNRTAPSASRWPTPSCSRPTTV